jgi:hypothetical protein
MTEESDNSRSPIITDSSTDTLQVQPIIHKLPSNPRDFFARLYETEPTSKEVALYNSNHHLQTEGKKQDSSQLLISPAWSTRSDLSRPIHPSVPVDPASLLARQLLVSSNFQWGLMGAALGSFPELSLPPALTNFRKFALITADQIVSLPIYMNGWNYGMQHEMIIPCRHCIIDHEFPSSSL